MADSRESIKMLREVAQESKYTPWVPARLPGKPRGHSVYKKECAVAGILGLV